MIGTEGRRGLSDGGAEGRRGGGASSGTLDGLGAVRPGPAPMRPALVRAAARVQKLTATAAAVKGRKLLAALLPGPWGPGNISLAIRVAGLPAHRVGLPGAGHGDPPNDPAGGSPAGWQDHGRTDPVRAGAGRGGEDGR